MHALNLLRASAVAPLPLKHELAEVALVEPPPEFDGLAVTLVDGPFFSTMPFPAEALYSLTHVRYTPHYSWMDAPTGPTVYELGARLPKVSRWRHIVQDARQYLPCLDHLNYRTSLFDVKTVLLRNERDDGRPILLPRHVDAPGIISIMGAKIDNIYDLFAAMPQLDPRLRDANMGLLIG